MPGLLNRPWGDVPLLGGASEPNDDRAFLVVSDPEVLGAAYDQGVDVQVLSTTKVWLTCEGGWSVEDFAADLDGGIKFRIPYDLTQDLDDLLALKESLDHD